MQKETPRVPEWVGHSIESEDGKRQWRALIEALLAEVKQKPSQHGVVFHGTSSEKADTIMSSGMAPTEMLRRNEEG